MPVNIDDHRCKLIDKILLANSHNEVQISIYTPVKELKEHRVHNYIIRKFLDKTIESLQDVKPCNHNSHQYINIKMSKTVVNLFKTSI